MKKLLFMLASVSLLTSCGTANSTTPVVNSTPTPSLSVQVSSSVATSSTQIPISNSIVSSSTTPIDPASILVDFTFEGYEKDDTIFDFFNLNWSTAGSRFEPTFLKLLRKDGFVRTPVLAEHSNSLNVSLYTHITGLQNIDSSAIGTYIDLRVEGVKANDEAEYDIIDSVTYKHTVTAEDVTNNSFADFPAYSSDFSNDPYTVTLNGEGIEKVRVVMYNKIIYGADQDGCNVDIRRMIITDNK